LPWTSPFGGRPGPGDFRVLRRRFAGRGAGGGDFGEDFRTLRGLLALRFVRVLRFVALALPLDFAARAFAIAAKAARAAS